jgi:tripartite-type tricarboxylate transporter receptor subunit TctC
VIHPSLPVKTVKDLIALAKARPGVLNHSMGSAGSSAHLAGELFKSMAGINMTGIAYRSDAMEIADILSGQIDLTFGTAAFAMAHVKSGRLRAVAVTSLQSSVLFPGLVTVAASGLPGYETGTVMGLFAPAGTRTTVIGVLHQEVTRALRSAETRHRFLAAGIEPVGSSPEESANLVRSEMSKWGKVIRDAGIKAN